MEARLYRATYPQALNEGVHLQSWLPYKVVVGSICQLFGDAITDFITVIYGVWDHTDPRWIVLRSSQFYFSGSKTANTNNEVSSRYLWEAVHWLYHHSRSGILVNIIITITIIIVVMITITIIIIIIVITIVIITIIITTIILIITMIIIAITIIIIIIFIFTIIIIIITIIIIIIITIITTIIIIIIIKYFILSYCNPLSCLD